jgi:hypothetical protein
MKILLCLFALTLSGCLAVSGTIGYTEPRTGATVGLRFGDAGKNVKPLNFPKGFAK